MTTATISPVPFLSGGFKLAYATTVTINYNSADYDAVFTAAESFDHFYDLLWALIDRWEADGAPAGTIVAYADADGHCNIEADDVLDLDEAIAAGGTNTNKILYMLGLDPTGYAATNPITGTNVITRAFFPQLPAQRAPGSYSRTLNPARATYRRANGGIQGSTCLAPQGGFVVDKIGLQFLEDITASTDDQAIYNLARFLTGMRTLATDIDFGGGGWQTTWTGSRADDVDMDSLPTGGACENPFTYFSNWEDYKGDYQATSNYAAFRAAQDLLGSEYYLHPDAADVVISQKFEGVQEYWLTEFDVFEVT